MCDEDRILKRIQLEREAKHAASKLIWSVVEIGKEACKESDKYVVIATQQFRSKRYLISHYNANSCKYNFCTFVLSLSEAVEIFNQEVEKEERC